MYEQINTCIFSCTYSRKDVRQIHKFCGVGVYLQYQLKQHVRWLPSCISLNSSIEQVRTYISRYTSIRYVQQVRTYSSRYALRKAGAFFPQYTYVYLQQVHAVRTPVVRYERTECRCSRYLLTLQQDPCFSIYIYIPTYISSAARMYSSTQYVLNSSRYDTCAKSSRCSSRYSRHVNAAICTSLCLVRA